MKPGRHAGSQLITNIRQISSVFFLQRNTFFFKKNIFQQDPGCCFWKKNTADHIFFMMMVRLPKADSLQMVGSGLSLHRWACCQSALQNLHRSSQRFDRSWGWSYEKKFKLEGWVGVFEFETRLKTELVNGCTSVLERIHHIRYYS